MTPDLLIQSTIIGLSIGSIYILMALGLTLMFGMMHIINFAHGAVYMLGAFAIYYVYFQWRVPDFAALLLLPLLLGWLGELRAGPLYQPLHGRAESPPLAPPAPPRLPQAAR